MGALAYETQSDPDCISPLGLDLRPHCLGQVPHLRSVQVEERCVLLWSWGAVDWPELGMRKVSKCSEQLHMTKMIYYWEPPLEMPRIWGHASY